MINPSQNKNFTGIWIPTEVWHKKNLSLIEKVFLGVIIGLTKNEQGYCTASNSFFAKLFDLSKRRVIDIIGSLEAKGVIHNLIIRTEKGGVEGRRISLGELNCTSEENFTSELNCTSEETNKRGSELSFIPLVKETAPNNKEIINNDNKKPKKEYSQDVLNLKKWSSDYFNVKYLDKSEEVFEKLIRDKYSPEQIKLAIKRARQVSFWDDKFLSPMKLREKDKSGVYYIDRFLALKSEKSTGQILKTGDEKRQEEFKYKLNNQE